MFGKSMDLTAKRDMMGAVAFFFANLVAVAGLSTVLVHFFGIAGVIEASGSFFEGGSVYTTIGTLFTLWLGGMVLTKRGLTSDIMSIIVVMVGVYLAFTSGIMLGLVPIALLTTMNK
jgi:hypothetical protein